MEKKFPLWNSGDAIPCYELDIKKNYETEINTVEKPQDTLKYIIKIAFN